VYFISLTFRRVFDRHVPFWTIRIVHLSTPAAALLQAAVFVSFVHVHMALRSPQPILALPVPRAAAAAATGKPTRVSAPLQLASYARDASGRLHFPGFEFLRSFRKPAPPQDLAEGQDSFVDKDDDAGSSVEPIIQGWRTILPCVYVIAYVQIVAAGSV